MTDRVLDPGLRFTRERYADCIPEIHLLLPGHYAEVKHAPDRITLNLDDAGYRQIEDLGNLVLVTARAARAAPRLVGYHLTFLRNDLHSVHTLIGYVDSYYLLPEYRRGWNGFRLIRESERVLRELGVQKVYVGATEHMQTENLFRFGKYQIEEKIFSKLL